MAKLRLNNKFIEKACEYLKDGNYAVTERVAYRCGSELLFWRNYIEFKT